MLCSCTGIFALTGNIDDRMRLMRKIIAVALAVSLAPTAALANDKRDQSADMGDSNRVICKKLELTGSRLAVKKDCRTAAEWRSEEHTSELQSLMRSSYAGFPLKKKPQ